MDAISQDEAVEASANQETEERTGLVTREQETERKKRDGGRGEKSNKSNSVIRNFQEMFKIVALYLRG